MDSGDTDKRLEIVEQLQRALLGETQLTPLEVAAAAGVDLALARRLWRALGFPPVRDDESFFTPADVEMLRAACALAQQPGSDPHIVLQLTRVMGQSLARIAEAQIAALSEPLQHAVERGGPQAVAELAGSTLPGVEPFLGYVWRRHLLASLRRFYAGMQEAEDGTQAEAVGFADLVGFTALSQQLDESQLASLVDRFEERAYEHIPHRGGRVIKMIGDEVMFAAGSATDAAHIALDLVQVFTGDDTLPEIRVGAAWGPTLSWQGDLFGPTVNLASRLVNIARPGTVLISESMAAKLRGDPTLVVRLLRPLRLKGLGKATFAVLRPATITEPSTAKKRLSKKGARETAP